MPSSWQNVDLYERTRAAGGTLTYEEAMQYEEVAAVDRFMGLSAEARLKHGFPVHVERDAPATTNPAFRHLYEPAPNLLRGQAVHAAIIDARGHNFECALVGSDGVYGSVFGTTDEAVVADPRMAMAGYELEHNPKDHARDALLSPTPAWRYQNSLTRLVLGDSDSGSSPSFRVDHEALLYCRYRRPDGNVAGLFATVASDVSTVASLSTRSLRLEHHLANLVCQQGYLLENERYAELATMYEDASNLLSSVVDPTFGTDNTFVTLERLFAHNETTVLTRDGAHFASPDVQVRFWRDDNNVLPYPAVRSFFVLLLLDAAALHGHGTATADIGPDFLTIMIRAAVNTFWTRPGYAASFVASHAANSTLANRLMNVARGLQRAGIGVNWSITEVAATHVDQESETRKLLDISATLHGARLEIISSGATMPTAGFPSQQSPATTSDAGAAQSSPAQATLPEVVPVPQLPEAGPTWSLRTTHIVFVEDQRSLCAVLKTYANDYDFGSVATVASADDVAVLALTLKSAIERFQRVVISFDENVYGLDTSLERIPTTGTELRDALLRIPIFRRAHAESRLIFVAYSSTQVRDSRVHQAYRKAATTPRQLLRSLVAFLDASTSSLYSHQQRPIPTTPFLPALVMGEATGEESSTVCSLADTTPLSSPAPQFSSVSLLTPTLLDPSGMLAPNISVHSAEESPAQPVSDASGPDSITNEERPPDT